MLQESVYELFEKLFEKGYTVLLETGGQISLEKLDRRVHKIVDFKCPSSGMGSHNFYQNVQYLTQKDELKFVIGDRNDFNWACALIREHDLTSLVDVIAFSPVFEKLPYSELANWVLHCGLRVRLQVQLHKIIWPDIPRGV
jgi:7-carboxy-7-deazaguanine synthase